ncbi:uncharacterized protein HKW66_Vig0110660 [Vigna angularis]|uniref:Uncharacterized protein n=1 Tax=Phaseolus angularis TaxID=3914 RepID=A0A8T0KWU1_PHAAN|nr:uncharacterized protein HKW66_Vig0110660 [Vigna angularis]
MDTYNGINATSEFDMTFLDTIEHYMVHDGLNDNNNVFVSNEDWFSEKGDKAEELNFPHLIPPLDEPTTTIDQSPSSSSSTSQDPSKKRKGLAASIVELSENVAE